MIPPSGDDNIAADKLNLSRLPTRTESSRGLGVAMRVPTLHYRKANESEDKGFAPYVTGIIGAGALISALVWALVIAKLIDLYRMH